MDYYKNMDPHTEYPLARKQHFLLVLGMMLLICGAGLILTTTGMVPAFLAFSYTLLTMFGMLITLTIMRRRKNYTWLFLGLVMVFSGIVFLALRAFAPQLGIKQLWPLVMVFIGLSIVPAGYFRARKAKALYLIPAAGFVILGAFFLLFSLEVLSLSLRAFMYRLWPFFFIAAGIIVLGMYIGNRIRFAQVKQKEE